MSTDDAWRPRLVARARLKFDPIAKQELLLFPEAALALNDTGAAIVRLCDGARSTQVRSYREAGNAAVPGSGARAQ